MSTLHIVFAAELPEALARSWSAGDALLLAGPCVLAAWRAPQAANLPQPCFALHDALVSRGLRSQWPASIRVIDHDEWVALLAQHTRSLSWS